MLIFCPVCNKRRTEKNTLCPQCYRSYDNHITRYDASPNSIALWAANRARLFERAKYQAIRATPKPKSTE